MVINAPWYCTKALATPEQTATGKEILNPLIADSLLKTIRLSVHLVIAMKHSLVHSKGLMLWCISDEMQLKTKSQRELYFVKFIINPEKDEFVPRVILGRSFLRLSQGVIDFGNGEITIYLEPDPFEDDSEKTRKSPDDWDQLLDFNFDDVPKTGEELPLFVCKMGKSNRNKKRAMENFNLFYQNVGPSSSAGRHLIQEEAAKEELAIKIS
ncbi:hypothetical protein Tco_1441271 [Tanacetum coccineum]